MRHLLLGAMLVGPAACTTVPLACGPPASPATRIELLFGRDVPTGGEVSEAEWQDFLDRVVTPQFPDGLTVIAGEGQWRSPGSTGIVSERNKVLVLFVFKDDDLERKVLKVTDAYRARFHQEAVLGSYSPACVAFH
jgi:hypothetical protein